MRHGLAPPVGAAGTPPLFAAPPPQGAVAAPTVEGLPHGFVYGVTRYADVILATSFPGLLGDLCDALSRFDAHVSELAAGGGSRTPFVARFDASRHRRGWGKRRIEIAKTIDGQLVAQVRGHEIDMFGPGSPERDYPGVAVEMEWNNKDPFFDRDLVNFQALHREGALAVGVIVTRGPRLQRVIKPLFAGAAGEKYGEATTHWGKLIPRVELGAGGECPLLLVGIEPEAVRGLAPEVAGDVLDTQDRLARWPSHYATRREAQEAAQTALRRAREAMGA